MKSMTLICLGMTALFLCVGQPAQAQTNFPTAATVHTLSSKAYTLQEPVLGGSRTMERFQQRAQAPMNIGTLSQPMILGGSGQAMIIYTVLVGGGVLVTSILSTYGAFASNPSRGFLFTAGISSTVVGGLITLPWLLALPSLLRSSSFDESLLSLGLGALMLATGIACIVKASQKRSFKVRRQQSQRKTLVTPWASLSKGGHAQGGVQMVGTF